MIRSRILKGFVFFVTLIFIVRLLFLQVFTSSYARLSENNAILEVIDYPERGFIYDRNSKFLVTNQVSYDIMVIPKDLKEFDTLFFCQLAQIKKSNLIKKMEKAKKFSSLLPSIVVNQISKEVYAHLQEHIWKFKGFFVQKKSIRDYQVPFASNVLGYVSEVNQNDLKKNSYYNLGELIGRQGIEKSYEKELRGTKGKQFYQKDRFNRIIESYKNGAYDTPSSPSKNIYLTIDSELQGYGKEIMQNKRGGIVAIEPKTGEVLALISAPSYNPSLLVGNKRSKNYRILNNDTIAKPLFDRALLALYPPGSPFKLVNALIGLEEGVITPKTKFTCNKGHYYARGAFMKCHCSLDAKIQNNLSRGIYLSCNTYFANTFKNIIEKYPSPSEGLNKWAEYLKSFGLGNYLGYDLPIGRKGLVPTSNYYDKVYGKNRWQASTMISNAIGQGEILTTPIQLANLTAAIANRGYYIQPHFVRSIDSVPISKDSLPTNKIAIKKEHFETIIEEMSNVVKKGTAKIARIKDIEVCGKTGTTENFTKIGGKKVQLTDHSIFVAFAPKENPQIAIAVFIENGYWGGRWAAPIASLMIEKHLKQTVKRKWLEKYVLKGDLTSEYEKPLTGKPFRINE